jgi:hypothetical protein
VLARASPDQSSDLGFVKPGVTGPVTALKAREHTKQISTPIALLDWFDRCCTGVFRQACECCATAHWSTLTIRCCLAAACAANAGLVGALALPMTLTTAMKVAFGSKWLVALRRAQAAGKMLAIQLAQVRNSCPQESPTHCPRDVLEVSSCQIQE